MFFQKRIQTPVIFQVCKQTAVNFPKYKQATHLKKCKQTAESQLDMGHVLGWVVVDTWTTVMSPDNECGFYCEHPDGHYYTIGITNR